MYIIISIKKEYLIKYISEHQYCFVDRIFDKYNKNIIFTIHNH